MSAQWRRYETDDGRVYFHDSVHNVTQWQRPDAEVLNESKGAESPAQEPTGPVWRKMAVAKFGSDEVESASQIYYLNTRTNKTQWDKPQDYDGDCFYYKSRTIAEPVEFEDDIPLAERLAELDFSSAAAEEALKAVAKGEESDECYITLNNLFCFIQSTGSDVEWHDAFACQDFKLLKCILVVFTQRAVADFIDLAARIFAMMSELQPQLWAEYVTQQAESGNTSVVSQMIDLARVCNTRLLTLTAEIMEASTSGQSEMRAQLEEDIRVWILLLTHLMSCDFVGTYCTDGRSVEQDVLASLGRWIQQCTRTVLTLMTIDTENTHSECVTLLLALNHQAKRVHRQNTDASISSIVKLCGNATDAGLSEGLLHVFNEVGYPYSSIRPSLVEQCLELFLDLMSTPKTAELLYTNDLRVMVDVILREMGNIPLDQGKSEAGVDLCPVLLQYVKLTELMILNSQWKTAGESYRSDQLLGLLESTLDHAREVRKMNIVEEIERVLEVCLPMLE